MPSPWAPPGAPGDTLEVIAEYDIDTLFPVRTNTADDARRRSSDGDMPLGRRPEHGSLDLGSGMQRILDLEVEV